MNAERLLKHYEQIADAPDAIARLRRFILELAVRGRLVPQNLGEEAAKGFRKPTDPAAPFELPNNWKWIEIGDQLDLLNGMAFKPTDWTKEGLRIVRIQNLNNPEAPFNFCNLEMARERSRIDNGSFLISWSGTPGTSFGAFIWDRGPAVLNQHIFRCDFRTKAFIGAFLRLAINGRLDEMIAKAHGGVGLQHITKGKLEALLIPLPPLAEQQRIVVKVDELMSLCDRLEAARAGREAVRDRLAAASLARLNTPDLEAFQADARFALDALPAITTRPDQIKALRQTILNLAVRGKLAPQNPNDEPASELLKRIAKEIPASKTGKSAAEPPPYDAPQRWVWTQLGKLVAHSDAGWSPKTHDHSRSGDAWGVLKVSAVSWDKFRSWENKQVLSGTEPRLQAEVKQGDFLISRANTAELIARAVLVDEPAFKLMMSDKIVRLRLSENCCHRFVWIVNNYANFAREHYVRHASGVSPSMKNVSRDVILSLPFPLPPLAEQHRIVARVDALMALCDRLEASLTAAAATRHRLLDALLAEALAPADDRELEAVA